MSVTTGNQDFKEDSGSPQAGLNHQSRFRMRDTVVIIRFRGEMNKFNVFVSLSRR